MWSKTEHCCKCLTAGFFFFFYWYIYPSNLRIWTNGTKEPSNLVPGTCILVNVFIILQDLHFIWITQIAIYKLQMTKCDVRACWTSKLVQVWERGIRNVIIILWIIFIFMFFQCKECFIKCTFFCCLLFALRISCCFKDEPLSN